MVTDLQQVVVHLTHIDGAWVAFTMKHMAMLHGKNKTTTHIIVVAITCSEL